MNSQRRGLDDAARAEDALNQSHSLGDHVSEEAGLPLSNHDDVCSELFGLLDDCRCRIANDAGSKNFERVFGSAKDAREVEELREAFVGQVVEPLLFNIELLLAWPPDCSSVNYANCSACKDLLECAHHSRLQPMER